jgi:uncharacterized membrane protein
MPADCLFSIVELMMHPPLFRSRREFALGPLMLCVLMSACNRQSETLPAANTAANPSATATTDGAAPPDTESGLAIKRGVVSLGETDRRYRACGATADVELHDQTEKLLDKVYADMGGKPIYIEAYGQRAGDAGKPSFVLEELLFATAQDPAAECSRTANQYELLALGRDPSWSVEVTPDSLVLKQSNAPTEIVFTDISTTDSEGTVTYRAGADKHVLELTVTQRACHDSNHAYYGYGVTAKFDKQTLNGCARLGD